MSIDGNTIEYRNPEYADAAHTIINVEINHPEYGWIPFTCNSADTEQHGVDLHTRITTDGGISDYVAPTYTTEELTEFALDEEHDLLLELDRVISNPIIWAGFTSAEQTELSTYRSAILAVKNGVDYPTSYSWPDKPQCLIDQL